MLAVQQQFSCFVIHLEYPALQQYVLDTVVNLPRDLTHDEVRENREGASHRVVRYTYKINKLSYLRNLSHRRQRTN